MSLVVYLALAAALVMAQRHGPGRALLAVYLPMLMLIPDGFRAITPGLPDPNFNQAAILPVIALALMRYGPQWRPVPMDALVLAYAAWIGYSDYTARGYSDAQNLMFSMLTSVVAPYAAARLIIGAEGLHVALARRLVFLAFAVALIGFWEFRMGFNPFHALIGNFFPGQGTGWVTTFRHGVARVAGPYSHAILAGIIMVAAFRWQRWLQWGGHWEPRFARMPWLPVSKATGITTVLLLGTIMTVARGPWLGALVGAAVVAVGRARNRRRAMTLAAIAVTLGAMAGFWTLGNYLDIAPGAAMTASQESALYRKELFEKYLSIALDQAWLGWGLTTWPKVRGMESIDNYYLLLALMHGLPTVLMLVAMLGLASVQCLRRGLSEPAEANSPGYTFAAIFVAVFVSLGTVYLGEQVLPLLFLMLGWSQAWLQHPVIATPGQRHTLVPAEPARPRFRHIIQ